MISLQNTRINENLIISYVPEYDTRLKIETTKDIIYVDYESKKDRDASLSNLDKFLKISCCE